MSIIHIRVPDDVKKAAQAVAQANGLDLSTCIRMYLQHVKVRGVLPLPSLTVNGFTEEEEQEILKRSSGPKVRAKTIEEALKKFKS